jgi:hypothetical protein
VGGELGRGVGIEPQGVSLLLAADVGLVLLLAEGVLELSALVFVFDAVSDAGDAVGFAVEGLAAGAALSGQLGNVAVVAEKDSINAGESLLGL